MPHPPKKRKNLKKREYENETNAEASHFYGSIHVTTEVSSGCWQLVVDEQNFPTFPPKKKKVEKPYPLQPPTFPGRPFRQRRLCASKMPLLLPVVYMLYAPMYITSLRIASDTRVSPFFFCTTMQLHRNLSTNVYYVCPSCILGLFHTRYPRLVRH